MLAHQGGWDELLIAGALVLLILAVTRRFRRPAPPDQPRSTAEDVCAFCGGSLGPDDVRCPSCGYRRRATTPPP
jgi:hypothetical protein